MPRDQFERKTSVNLVSNALNNLGIPSKVNCRYDIVIDDKKVSGSAYKLSGQSAYHHGTMLISTDLDILRKNLTAKKSDLIEGGGVESVRSFVTRLREYHSSIDHEMFVNAVIQEFSTEYGSGEIINVDENYLQVMCPQVFNRAKELESRDWIFGQTPKFTLTLPEFTLTIENGIISSMFPPLNSAYLKGLRFERLFRESCGVKSNLDNLLKTIVDKL